MFELAGGSHREILSAEQNTRYHMRVESLKMLSGGERLTAIPRNASCGLVWTVWCNVCHIYGSVRRSLPRARQFLAVLGTPHLFPSIPHRQSPQAALKTPEKTNTSSPLSLHRRTSQSSLLASSSLLPPSFFS